MLLLNYLVDICSFLVFLQITSFNAAEKNDSNHIKVFKSYRPLPFHYVRLNATNLVIKQFSFQALEIITLGH